MGFTEAVKSFYARYVDFETRSSRSEYWWVVLFQFLVYIVLGVLAAAGGALTGDLANEEFGVLGMLFLGLLVLFMLGNIIPGIAVTVRRFHDQDKSGWFYLLGFIPYIGGLILIVFMCIRGTDGPNRFGLDPLGGVGSTFD